MELLNVEDELLDQYRMLLEIPRTREILHNTKETLLLRFKEHIAQYLKQKKESKIAGVDNDNSDIEASPERKKEFDFHLKLKNGKWVPVIDPGNSVFGAGDLVPDGLIEYITGHTYAEYHWYYIEHQTFSTKNHGLLEFNGRFKYIDRGFITGRVEISGGGSDRLVPAAPRHVQPESVDDNIIHMNKNQKQFLEILNDRQACEFLHYFCTFPFYRDMILQDFRTMKPYLSEKFEKIINGLE
jgi:hypothetical protein